MKLVVYFTKKQGSSGDTQKRAIAEFKERNTVSKVVAEYTEVELDRNSNWPKLREAITQAKATKATLLIARMDRLAWNVSFTSVLLEAGVEFLACDNPTANHLTIQILAQLAQTKAVSTSRRTKDALAAASARGVKLGSARPGHWKGREHKRGWKKGAKKSAEARTHRAMAAYSFLVPRMKKMKEDGDSYEKIAEKLTASGHQTTTGKPFTGTAVWRVLKRFEEVAA